jgi:hypothetical protein
MLLLSLGDKYMKYQPQDSYQPKFETRRLLSIPSGGPNIEKIVERLGQRYKPNFQKK